MTLRKLAAVLAVLIAAWTVPAQAQLTKASVTSQIAGCFPDNSAGAITPAIVRTCLNSIVNSYQQFAGVNAQIGTTYTVGVADYGQLLTFSNAAPVAVALPTANGSFTTFNVFFSNVGAGAITITPSVSTIGGAATLVLNTNQSAWVVSDGTNYQVFKGVGTGTLNSVALTMPSCFAVAGSPITGTSGTFIVTTTGTQGGIPWFTSATDCGSSAALTQFGMMYGGGTGTAPAATAAATNGQLWVGQTAGAPLPKTMAGDVTTISAAGAVTLGKVNTVTYPSSGTSGGVNCYTSTSGVASSGLLAANGPLYGGGAGVCPGSAAAGTNGQLYLGVTGSAPQMATMSQDCVITNAGVITCTKTNNVSFGPFATQTAPCTIAQGCSAQTTVAAARGASGYNIDEVTTFGNVSYVAAITDRVIATSVNFTAQRTVTLPAVSTYNAGQITVVVDSQGAINGANTLVIAAAGGDTINGTASITITTQYGGAVLWPIGANKWGYIAAAAGGGGGTMTSIAAGAGIATGTGSAITVSGTLYAISAPQGRLTLQSATPVMTTSQSGKTSLLYDCYLGGRNVPYFNGTDDLSETISGCEVTDAMVSAASAGQVVSGQVYDVWWVHGGANRICLAMSSAVGGGGGWASDTGGSNTARGSGYSQLDSTTRPYTTNKNSITNCFNGSSNYGTVAVNQATYIGTVYASANGQISYTFGASASGGTAALFGVWNAYNRVQVTTNVIDTAAGYAYTSASIRQANASAGNQISWVQGIADDGFYFSYNSEVNNGASGAARFGMGLDVTNAFTNSRGVNGVASLSQSGFIGWAVTPGLLGSHTIAATEGANGANATTFNNNSDNVLSGTLRM